MPREEVFAEPLPPGAFASLGRLIGFLSLGIALNVFGAWLSTSLQSILFLDTVGTALISLAYGPIQGGIVGILSNALGSELITHPNYVLFGTVHLWLALVWGLLPRAAQGKFSSDIFNPRYSYRRLVFGLIFLSFVAALGTSGVVAFLKFGNASYSCVNYKYRFIESHFEHIRCAIADRLKSFTHSGLVIDYILNLIVNFPDKLISIGSAYFIVETSLRRRRLCQKVPSNSFISTNRLPVSLAAIGLFVLSADIQLSVLRHQHLSHHMQIGRYIYYADVTFVALLFFAAFVWRLDFAPKRNDHILIYTKQNDHSEKVFDDLCKISVICFFLIYVILTFIEPQETMDTVLARNLDGALSVFVIITLANYIIIIYGRIFNAYNGEVLTRLP